MFAFAAGAALADPPGPMQQVASDLGTPKIGYTARDAAHTHSMFEFVRNNETVNNWTKLFTVVAVRVDSAQTQAQTKAEILRLRGLLAKSHATISAYDVRDQPPPVVYFKYVLGGETNVGVIFSPIQGIITTQQVAARRSGVISARDIRRIKQLVGYPG